LLGRLGPIQLALSESRAADSLRCLSLLVGLAAWDKSVFQAEKPP